MRAAAAQVGGRRRSSMLRLRALRSSSSLRIRSPAVPRSSAALRGSPPRAPPARSAPAAPLAVTRRCCWSGRGTRRGAGRCLRAAVLAATACRSPLTAARLPCPHSLQAPAARHVVCEPGRRGGGAAHLFRAAGRGPADAEPQGGRGVQPERGGAAAAGPGAAPGPRRRAFFPPVCAARPAGPGRRRRRLRRGPVRPAPRARAPRRQARGRGRRGGGAAHARAAPHVTRAAGARLGAG